MEVDRWYWYCYISTCDRKSVSLDISLWFSFKLVFISKINAMFTWALKPNKISKHRLIWWRNVGSLTFFVCICFVMAPKSRYLKSVNHKIVTWNTNRPRRLYFTIFFNLLFLYFPIFSLNCIYCHLFSNSR